MHYKNANQAALAIAYYDKLLLFATDDELKAKVHLSKGMIHFNANNIDNAIASFLFVLNDYAQTTSFKQALAGLRATYVSIAKADEYLNIVNALPQVSISRAEQDSLTYNTAFMKFAEGDYGVAKTTFQQYLSNFKEGIFSLDANYYLAESCVKLKDTTCAIGYFDFVVKANQKNLEAANLFLARHYFSLNDFEAVNIDVDYILFFITFKEILIIVVLFFRLFIKVINFFKRI